MKIILALIISASLVSCGGGGTSGNDVGVSEVVGWGLVPSILPPSSNTEARKYISQASEVSSYFNSRVTELSQSMGSKEALQETIDELKNDSKVVAIEASPKVVLIYLDKGEPVAVLLDADYRVSPDNLGRSAGTSKNKSKKNSPVSPGSRQPRISPSGDGRALILSGYQNDFNENICPIKVALEQASFAVDFVVDKTMCGVTGTEFDGEITEYVNSFDNYDVIYINTHGGINKERGWNAIGTGIRADDPDNPSEQLVEFAQQPGVGLFSSGAYYITGNFIRSRYQNRQFNNTYVHVDACHTGEPMNDGVYPLASAFLENGAAVYTSYNNTTQYNVQTTEFTVPFFEKLTTENINVESARSGLTQHWTLRESENCRFFSFGCQIVEEEGVDVVIRNSSSVLNDVEGYILVPASEVSPPDLVVTSLTNPSFSEPGARIGPSVRARNLGKEAVGEFYTGFYLSADNAIDTTDRNIGSCLHSDGAIEGADSECHTGVIIPDDVVPGIYYFGAIVDFRDDYIESDDTNNVYVSEDQIFVQLPSNTIPQGYWGSWEGTGTQSSGSTWSIEIYIDGGRAEIDFPSLGCGGTLELLEATSDQLRFSENLDYGRDRCVTDLQVVLEARTDGALDFYEYRSSGTVAATGTVEKVSP